MPLREVLQNFLAHVADLDRKYQQREEDVYEAEFQNLKALTEELRAQPQYSCSQGEQDVNRRKNRYKDILPYDGNRVTLGEVASSPGSTYINASFIKGASGSTAYIASQAPLPHTVDDFWRMIWEWEVQVVVMASNEIEGGRQKCVRYWPGEGDTLQFGDISVSLVGERSMGTDYTVKELSARSGDVNRTIHHFHYTTWPDHGVPLAVQPIIEMVGFVRKFQVSETLPVLVHCSAGCGRTGTVCAIDFVWGLLRAGKLHKDFSLKQLIFDMRKQRIAMVQTKEQYVLVHRAVKELFEEHLKVIDNHPYENIDFSGRPLILNEEPDYESIIIDPRDADSHSTSASVDGCATNASGDTSGGSDKQGKRSRSRDSAGSAAKDDERPAAPLPPLPTKTRVGQPQLQQLVTGGGSSDGAATAMVGDREEASTGSPRGINDNGGDDNSPTAELSARHADEDKSRMDYVSNWCNGLASGAGKLDDAPLDGSQSDLGVAVRGGSSLVSESRVMSGSKATLASEDSGGPPLNSSSNRPSSSSPSPSGGGSGGGGQPAPQQPPSRTRKNRFQKRSTPAEPDDRIKVSRLVRKPSIAKLKALFETDSSSPPSPDPGYDRDTSSPLKSTNKPGSTTGSTTTDLSSSATDFNSANTNASSAPGGAGDTTPDDDRRQQQQQRKRGRKLYVDRCEFDAATERYVDTALRIFSEFRRSSSGAALDNKMSESYRVLSSSPVPPPADETATTTTNAAVTARVSSSTVSLSSSSSQRDDERRRSHSSHSPSPGAGDTSTASTSAVATLGGSSSSSELGVAQQAKELVGRFRRPRRNSSSAEKRPLSTLSTWYDGEDANSNVTTVSGVVETPKEATTIPVSPALSSTGNRKQNRVAQLLFGDNKNARNKNVDKHGVPVKRSLSMKVGFRSPLLRRKSGGGGGAGNSGGSATGGAGVGGASSNENVAAYLGVEEGKRRGRVLGPRQHHHHHHRLSGGAQPGIPVLDGDTVVLIEAKNYVRRMQGYVNNSPRGQQLPGDPSVQLTNFRHQSDETGRQSPRVSSEDHRESPSPVRRLVDPVQQQQQQQQRHRSRQIAVDGVVDARVEETGGRNSPYASPGPTAHRRSRELGEGSQSPSLQRQCAPSPTAHVLANERSRSRSNSPRTVYLVSAEQPQHQQQPMTRRHGDNGDSLSRHSREDMLRQLQALSGVASSGAAERRTRSPQMGSSAIRGAVERGGEGGGRNECATQQQQQQRVSSPPQSSGVDPRARGYQQSSRSADGTRRHNFFGSEMDDYCQQIIQDCQEYLVHHKQPEYSNVTAEAQRNIRWIEETVLQSPRRAILDTTSSSENLTESTTCTTTTTSKQRDTRTTSTTNCQGSSDYERLWFSSSGGNGADGLAPHDDNDTAAATAATSVEEVSMSFLTAEDDDEDPGASDREDIVRRATHPDPVRSASGESSSGGGVSGGHILPKDVRFCRTVEELKSLIEELHVHDAAGHRAAAEAVRQRKPQPAPRTILNTVATTSPRAREREEADVSPAQRTNVPVERIYANCVMTAPTQQQQQVRDVRLEHATPLRSASPRHRAEEMTANSGATISTTGVDNNHDYEVIRFDGENHRRAMARNHHHHHRQRPTESQYGVLLGRNRVPPTPTEDLSLTERAQGEIAATRLYGQVHKPRRRKQSPPPPLLMPDGSSSIATRPLVRPAHDYEVLRDPAGWRDVESHLGAGTVPVAPPRVKRQPSSSSNKFRPEEVVFHEQPSFPAAVVEQEYEKEPWLVPRNKWEAEFDDDVEDLAELEDDDDSPPVPVKTKDAYRLPKANAGTNSSSSISGATVAPVGATTGASSAAINTSFDNVSSGSSSQASSSGMSITKALTKLHTNFFSKIGTKNNNNNSGSNNDKTEYDSSSVGSGSNTPPSTHKATTKNPSTTLGFPHRLESKPKGPRDPPAHWKSA